MRLPDGSTKAAIAFQLYPRQTLEGTIVGYVEPGRLYPLGVLARTEAAVASLKATGAPHPVETEAWTTDDGSLTTTIPHSVDIARAAPRAMSSLWRELEYWVNDGDGYGRTPGSPPPDEVKSSRGLPATKTVRVYEPGDLDTQPWKTMQPTDHYYVASESEARIDGLPRVASLAYMGPSEDAEHWVVNPRWPGGPAEWLRGIAAIDRAASGQPYELRLVVFDRDEHGWFVARFADGTTKAILAFCGSPRRFVGAVPGNDVEPGVLYPVEVLARLE